jgi:hypothetical protein
LGSRGQAGSPEFKLQYCKKKKKKKNASYGLLRTIVKKKKPTKNKFSKYTSLWPLKNRGKIILLL